MLLVVLLLSTISGFSQNQLEDVIYLNNGNIYRGMIIEEVPGVSMKIKTVGGNVFMVNITDVAKITKEEAVVAPRAYAPKTPKSETPQDIETEVTEADLIAVDTEKVETSSKKVSYFFQSQVLVENLQGGIRIVNGIRIGRFGYLGLGVGFDIVHAAPFNEEINGLDRKDLSGVYLPLYLYYSGEILEKRITPFYAVELGATVGFEKNGFDKRDDYENYFVAGAMGSAGVGVKFKTKKKLHFSILLNINYKYVFYEEEYIYYDVGGFYSYTETIKQDALLFFPGIRFGLGFN